MILSALPPVPGVCKAIIGWFVGDKAAANVLHFQYTPATSAPAAYVSALASGLAAAVEAQSALWSSEVTFAGVTVTDLSSDTGFVDEEGAETVGIRTGLAIPGNVAVLASYEVARRYRGGHPRTYWPWFTITDLASPQTWEGASVTEAEDSTEAIIGAGNDAEGGGTTTLGQVMVSYTLARAPRETPLVNAIEFSVIDGLVASQRRRDGRH